MSILNPLGLPVTTAVPVPDPQIVTLRAGAIDHGFSSGIGQRSAGALTWNDPLEDLAEWTLGGATPRLLANVVYGTGSVTCLAREVGLPISGQSSRFVARVHHVDPGAGSVGATGIYVSSDPPATIAGGTLTHVVGMFINEGLSGASSVRAATALVNGQAYVLGKLATGDEDFLLGIQTDELFTALFLRSADGTQEFRGYVANQTISGFGGVTASPAFAHTYVGLYLHDPRGTSGTSMGPVGFRGSLASVNPPSGLEDFTSSCFIRDAPSGTAFRVSPPAAYDANVPCPLVIYCHGGDGAFTDVQDAVIEPPLFAHLQSAYGVMVASSQAGGAGGSGDGNGFGDPTSLAAVFEMYEWITQHYNIGQVIFIGYSMGALTTSMTLANGEIPVDAIVLLAPLANLSWFNGVVQNPSSPLNTYLSDWEAAWGLPSGYTQAQYAAATAGYDPVLLPAEAWRNVPIFISYSTTDSRATPSDNAQHLISNLQSEGMTPTINIAVGDHADPSQFWNSGGAATGTNISSFIARVIGAHATVDTVSPTRMSIAEAAILAASKGLAVKEGAGAKQGTFSLSGARTTTVPNASVTAESRIFLTAQTLGTVATPSALCVSARTPGTSFTVTPSQPTDTSIIAYEIFEPAD